MASKVYILGAGSSIGHSENVFPSITDFFSCAKEFDLYPSKDFNNFKELWTYVKDMMGHNIYVSTKKIDIETVMTLIEIELERTASPRLLTIRQQLLELIQRVLNFAEKRTTAKKSEYDFLASGLQEKDTIITFNWDLLLDEVLNRTPILESYQKNKELTKYRSGQYYQFTLDLSALGEKTWQGAFIRDPYCGWNPPAGYYLKVHGSIDWYYCSNESCRFFRKVFPVVDPNKVYYCSECHEPLERLLIPPVLNKGYHQYPLIRRIWNLAAKEITSAEELIIWGYSMPSTDFHSAWLLRQCRKNPPKRLVIINPSVKTKKGTVAIGFVRRFYDIFRGKIEKEKESFALFESFSDYHAGKDILDKYKIAPAKKAYSKI